MKNVIGDMLSRTAEAPVHPDQLDVELKLLTTLAAVINTADQDDLKHDILSMTEVDFYFGDLRAVFATIRALADAGDHVEKIAVRAKIGGSWPDTWQDTLDAVFDASKADIAAILTVRSEADGKEWDVRLNILKNRNGRRGYVGMKYVTTRDTFTEEDTGSLDYLGTLVKDDATKGQTK